jgi:3-dehydroquinate synthase II
LKPGQEILLVDSHGECRIASVGRIKIERRPMLLIRAKTRKGEEGSVFLQNAETIHLATPGGRPVGLADLEPGLEILCHMDAAGRHFGLRIAEDIQEA